MNRRPLISTRISIAGPQTHIATAIIIAVANSITARIATWTISQFVSYSGGADSDLLFLAGVATSNIARAIRRTFIINCTNRSGLFQNIWLWVHINNLFALHEIKQVPQFSFWNTHFSPCKPVWNNKRFHVNIHIWSILIIGRRYLGIDFWNKFPLRRGQFIHFFS